MEPMMTKSANIEPSDPNSLEWKLECATVASWKDLSTGNIPEQIHLECHAGAGGRLEHLKIWSSVRRGEWDLVCDYWLVENNSSQRGTTFSSRFASKALARSLDRIMTNQESFPAFARLPFVLIQVQKPTPEGLIIADQVMAMEPEPLS